MLFIFSISLFKITVYLKKPHFSKLIYYECAVYSIKCTYFYVLQYLNIKIFSIIYSILNVKVLFFLR